MNYGGYVHHTITAMASDRDGKRRRVPQDRQLLKEQKAYLLSNQFSKR